MVLIKHVVYTWHYNGGAHRINKSTKKEKEQEYRTAGMASSIFPGKGCIKR